MNHPPAIWGGFGPRPAGGYLWDILNWVWKFYVCYLWQNWCYRLLPSKHNRAIWKVEKEINSMILKVVKQRIEASSDEKDLLQMILEGAKSHINDTDGLSIKFSRDKFMVDNCKTIYFAGQETTSITTSWCWCCWLHIPTGKLVLVPRCFKYARIGCRMPTCSETWKRY